MKDKSGWDFIPGMFFHPRKTIAMIVDGEHYEWVPAIAAIIGAGSALLQARAWQVGLEYGFWPVLIVSLVSGGLYGVLWLYLSGWLITVSGRWVGAKGDVETVRAALAWGRAPLLVVYVLFLFQLIMFGGRAFSASIRSLAGDPVSFVVVFLLNVAFLVFSVWSLVTTVAALSEVQRLSTAKTVGNLLTAGLLFALPAMLIFVLLMSMLHN
jgi:hypothetical protein